MPTSIDQYIKALNSLEEALLAHQEQPDGKLKKMLRDSVIQRFEFSLELAWKASVKKMGLNTTSPRTAVREMAQNNLIEDTELWFNFIEARNKTSHSYNEEIAKQVYLAAEKFLIEGKKLKSLLGDL